MDLVPPSGSQWNGSAKNVQNIASSIPAKKLPPLDSMAFSQQNMEESADIDLDTLLQELCALENELNSTNTSKALPQFASSSSSSTKNYTTRQNGGCNYADSATSDKVTSSFGAKLTVSNCFQRQIDLATPTGADFAQEHVIMASPAPLVSNKEIIASQESVSPRQLSAIGVANLRPISPGNDSAFCDSGSLTSSESILSSNHTNPTRQISSALANRPPSTGEQTQAGGGSVPNRSSLISLGVENLAPNSTEPEQDEKSRLRAEKIKIALDKMREANVKKIYVKFFYGTDPNNSKNLLIDERWTVGQVLKLVSEKFGVPYSINQALVEVCPDMHIERILEDHECLVENILLWTKESTNAIHFAEKSAKYDLFYNPHHYLLKDDKRTNLDSTTKQKLITDFFSNSQVRLPDMSGFLYLKSDGKKSWKKFYFTLRLSGLYVCTKGPKSKSSKDLVCLSQLENIQIYNSIGWKKKYKAPFELGFALKHPKIQVKSSKYIKYLCAENEESALQWVTSLRLAKFGKQLYDNFAECCERMTDEDSSMTINNSSDHNYRLPTQPIRRLSNGAISLHSLSVHSTPDHVVNPTNQNPLLNTPSLSSFASQSRPILNVLLWGGQSIDNLSGSGCCSVRGAGDGESATEADSDEELVSLGGAEVAATGLNGTGAAFPPPPPPHQLQFLLGGGEGETTPSSCGYETEDWRRSNGSRQNGSGDFLDSTHLNASAIAEMTSSSETSASVASSDAANNTYNNTGTVRRRQKVAPPAPPKRSDTTRLSTTLSAASSSQSLQQSATTNGWTSGATDLQQAAAALSPCRSVATLLAPKPPLPAKPKLPPPPPARLDLAASQNGSTDNTAIMSSVQNNITNSKNTAAHHDQKISISYSNSQDPTVAINAHQQRPANLALQQQNGHCNGKAAPKMEFQSELQMAMQKRLERLGNLENQ